MLREQPARCQEPGLAEAPWGEARSTPGGSARQGDGNRGGPALRAKATEPSGQRLGWERAQREYPCLWEQLWCCSRQARGWRPKTRFHLYLPSRHPEPSRGTGRVCERVADRPPGLFLHLPWSPPNSRMGVCLTSALPQIWEVPHHPLNQQGDPRNSS